RTRHGLPRCDQVEQVGTQPERLPGHGAKPLDLPESRRLKQPGQLVEGVDALPADAPLNLALLDEDVLGLEAPPDMVVAVLDEEQEAAELVPAALLEVGEERLGDDTRLEGEASPGLEGTRHGRKEVGVALVVEVSKTITETQRRVELPGPGQVAHLAVLPR